MKSRMACLSLFVFVPMTMPVSAGDSVSMNATEARGLVPSPSEANVLSVFWASVPIPVLDRTSRGIILSFPPWELTGNPAGISSPTQPGSGVELLEALARSSTAYAWSDEAGIVNGRPREGGWALIIKDILETPLASFSVEEESLEGAVRALIREAGRAGIGSFAVLPPTPRRPARLVESQRKFSVRLASPTIRDCLNAVVRAGGPAVWEAYPTDDGLALQIYSLTLAEGQSYSDLRSSIRHLERRKADIGLAAFEESELSWRKGALKRLEQARPGPRSP